MGIYIYICGLYIYIYICIYIYSGYIGDVKKGYVGLSTEGTIIEITGIGFGSPFKSEYY